MVDCLFAPAGKGEETNRSEFGSTRNDDGGVTAVALAAGKVKPELGKSGNLLCVPVWHVM